MRVTSLELSNFRSFERMDPIELDQINVLIGPNNSGKSTILKALHMLQNGYEPPFPSVRVNTDRSYINLRLEEVNEIIPWGGRTNLGTLSGRININSTDRITGSIDYGFLDARGTNLTLNPLPNTEPNHFIIPYFSKRKTVAFQHDVRAEFALNIGDTLTYLAAKLSRISNPGYPNHNRYKETCEAILGFLVTAVPSAQGQQPGTYLPDGQILPINQMGEGVPHIVGLLADLAISRGKLFLIEEPENDLHPEALKALLDLIIVSSASNQFVISTHSNIVVRHLGSADRSKLYHVSSSSKQLPVSAQIHLIASTTEARLSALRELGYSFSDFDLWDGWLILEESSAERIIRDYLIPWFTPKLNRIRTLAVGGADKIKPTVEDFFRLVRFTHLEEAYRNKAWVRIDGDEKGSEVISALQQKFPTWEANRFATFIQPQFEHYYPSYFSAKVIEVLGIQNKQERKGAKKMLLDEVRTWLDEDETRGKSALRESASEIINHLQEIENQLFS